MVARELPTDEILASWQHVEQRALDLRAAGLPGTLQELRVRAYLDLLQERDSRTTAADPGVTGQAATGSDHPPADQDKPGPGPDHPSADPDEPGPGSGGTGGPGGPGPAPAQGAAPGPSVAALVTLTIPLATYLGSSDAPGEADGYGVVDGEDARDLAAAAARHPRTRWCITALNPDGTAAAHACLRGPHGPHGAGPPGTGPRGHLPIRTTTPLTPITRGPCDHAHAEVGYHPTRKLTHLVRARNNRCTAPGCGRPAVRCDLDHTTAYDQGGRTCECNLAPPCKR